MSKEEELSIYGYPVSKYEKTNGKPEASKQYGLKRENYVLDFYNEAGYIVHRISAESGQSGAAVILTASEGRSLIVGIHIGSTEDNM